MTALAMAALGKLLRIESDLIAINHAAHSRAYWYEHKPYAAAKLRKIARDALDIAAALDPPGDGAA